MDVVAVGSAAPVLPMAGFLGDPLGLLQLSQGALDGGARKIKLPPHSADSRPAVALLVGSALEIHIDCHCPVGQSRGIDGIKIAHEYLLYTLTCPGLGLVGVAAACGGHTTGAEKKMTSSSSSRLA